jgi:peptidoglycan hydrolase-like protein with peptidoglycan-binding domain
LTRTVLTSIAKTCPACGATNTVVAATTEITPFWSMNCSRCGAAVAEGERDAASQAELGADETAPATLAAGTPAGFAERSADAAQRSRRLRRGAVSRCCTGLHMAAGVALGVIGTILLLEVGAGPTRPLQAGGDGAALAAAPDRDVAPGAPAALPSADRHASPTAGEWDAAVEAALDAELARLEAEIADDPPGGVYETLVDAETAERAEAALDLSRGKRRELQRRLKLAEHDPRMVDGIFGPATRAAIAGWQSGAGLPATGYFDGQALALIERQTEEMFRAWQVAEKRDRRRRQTQTASVATSMPATSPASASCQRTWSGAIAYGQNVFCDLRGLRENVGQLFRASERS